MDCRKCSQSQGAFSFLFSPPAVRQTAVHPLNFNCEEIDIDCWKIYRILKFVKLLEFPLTNWKPFSLFMNFHIYWIIDIWVLRFEWWWWYDVMLRLGYDSASVRGILPDRRQILNFEVCISISGKFSNIFNKIKMKLIFILFHNSLILFHKYVIWKPAHMLCFLHRNPFCFECVLPHESFEEELWIEMCVSPLKKVHWEELEWWWALTLVFIRPEWYCMHERHHISPNPHHHLMLTHFLTTAD